MPELQTAPTPRWPPSPGRPFRKAVWQDFQQTVVQQQRSATGGDAIFAIQRYVNGTLYGRGADDHSLRQRPAEGQHLLQLVRHQPGPELRQHPQRGGSFGAATLQVAANGTSPTVVVGYNDPTLSGAGCRVCHNASAERDGHLSNSYLTDGNSGGGSEATTFIYNPTLATPALIQGSQALIGSYGSNGFTFAAPSPDGTYLFTSAAPASANGASGLYTIAGNFDREQRPERTCTRPRRRSRPMPRT